MTQLTEQRVAEIAGKLSKAQRDFLRCYPAQRVGRPHGLIQRGLLTYRWGNDSSFGYDFTVMGERVRAHLERQQ